MKVKLLFFASNQDIADASEATAELTDTATVDDACAWLVDRWPKFAEALPKGRIAVNLEFVEREQKLADGDEIAFMPPMSGG
jgi:molybdopterin converting factor subunit 1